MRTLRSAMTTGEVLAAALTSFGMGACAFAHADDCRTLTKPRQANPPRHREVRGSEYDMRISTDILPPCGGAANQKQCFTPTRTDTEMLFFSSLCGLSLAAYLTVNS